MNQLFQSLRSGWQRTGLVLLGWLVLTTLPALTQTAFTYQEQEKPPLESVESDEPALGPTAFTYQGQLKQDGVPASDAYDFEFILYTAQTGGYELGAIVHEDIVLTNGLFRVGLDFGGTAFDGQESWLQVAVRPGESMDPYTVLSPRQRLTPTPYAILAQHEPWSLIGVPVGFAESVEVVKDIDLLKKYEETPTEERPAARAQGTANFIANLWIVK